MKLKEFAQSLGLSQTTVSRALNGYPEVSEATRRRVLKAADELNYRPNTRAKALATGQSMSIGHVFSLSNRREMISPIFAEFIVGASEVYSKHGYDIHVLFVREEDEKIAYRDMAAKGSVDGIVIHGPRIDDPRIDLITSLRIPFVVHGRATGITTPYSWVDVNNKRAFQRATDFLIDLGHHRIGFVNGLETMDFAMRRRAGYLSGLSEHGIEPDPGIMFSGEMTEQYGYEAALKLLAQPTPADGRSQFFDDLVVRDPPRCGRGWAEARARSVDHNPRRRPVVFCDRRGPADLHCAPLLGALRRPARGEDADLQDLRPRRTSFHRTAQS